MSNFRRNIHPHVARELRAAVEAELGGNAERAFSRLERAHILGQASTVEHLRVHWHMFLWGLRQHQPREYLGQIVRIVGAASKTGFGLVPHGNTGGSNVSPFKPMPVPPELEFLIKEARSSAG